MAFKSMQRAYAKDRVRALVEAREKEQLDILSGLEAAELEGLSKGIELGRAEVKAEATQKLLDAAQRPRGLARLKWRRMLALP